MYAFALIVLAAVAPAVRDPGMPPAVRHSGTPKARRIELIAPVAEGVLRCRPTFVSCGVCFGAATPVEGLKLEYRVKDGAWTSVEDFPYFSETKDYRGSICDLAEDTEYEVRVGGKTAAFRTWRSEVPVARTVELDPAGPFPVRLTEKGSPEGWIRYTFRGGAVVNPTVTNTIEVDGAEYVLIENVKFTGGKGRHAVDLLNGRQVRVRNCEFAHWGRDYEVRYDGLGRPFVPNAGDVRIFRNANGGYSIKGSGQINMDGAIQLERGMSETVIERCWFHDCRIHANSWYYSHPEGGEAITCYSPRHSTVIRWNDMTGSDYHRWNDAVESGGNFNEEGGLNRDADVYGNFMIFANDDCIELDGGQQNMRCFDNRFEAALCGVSIQGCMDSPVYLCRNGFFGMCEQFGAAGQTIKTGGGAHGDEPFALVKGNLLWGAGSGISMRELLGCKVVGNTFCDRQRVGDLQRSPRSFEKDNVFGASIDEKDLPRDVTRRPVGFTLDRVRFSGLRPGATVKVTAKSSSAAAIPFRVCINDDTPWVRVSPREGTIPAGGEQVFTVTLDAKRMDDRRDYRAAFLVRTPDGLSRGVSLYAETDFVPPAHPAKPGEVALYVPAKPEGGEVSLQKGDETVRTYEFTVPKTGRYYFLFHAKLQSDFPRNREQRRIMAGVDGEELQLSRCELYKYPVWAPIGVGNCIGIGLKYNTYDFKAGERHTLTIKSGPGSVIYDEVVLTDSLGSFEPR